MRTKMSSTAKLTVSGLCLAMCLVLPFLTGQIKEIGSALCPMHLPVFLCGFICGWPWGAAVGFVAPILRSAIFHMPVMFPGAVSMAFELAVYGLVSGYIYSKLPRSTKSTYIALVAAMLFGRAVWGIVRFLMAVLFNLQFTLDMFVAGAFITAIPGIALQLLLIPPIVSAVTKEKK